MKILTAQLRSPSCTDSNM